MPLLVYEPRNEAASSRRDAERRLGEVVGAEGEELGRLGDLAGAQGSARQLDHRADLVGDRLPCLLRDRLGHGDDALP